MSATIQLQLREDTAANWTSANPTLLSAEVGYENDTGKFKSGDGVTEWSALPYFGVLLTDANDNFFTKDAGASLLSGAFRNVLIGGITSTGVSAGDYNVAIGYEAGNVLGGAGQNILIGRETGKALTSAPTVNNVSIGDQSGNKATTGTNNTVVGAQSGQSISTASNTTVLGYNNLGDAGVNMTGTSNVALGTNNLLDLTSGTYNTGVGAGTFRLLETGNHNIAVGNNALDAVREGDNNVAIGREAGALLGSNNSDNNVFFGPYAGPTSLTEESNQLYISTVAGVPLIGGDFSTDIVTLRGSLRLTERADHILTPASTFGEIWMRASDSTLVFTDPSGTDYNLSTSVTVTDSTEIDFTLTGQDLTANLITGSIDVLKLDSGVQTSLGLADTALQSETSHADVLVDGDFATNGLMSRTGAGTYGIVTDNSADWNTAFSWGDHAGLYSPLAHTHLLAAGATDVTATATEVNLLDLAGLTAGWVLSADDATTASWKAPTGGIGGSIANDQIAVGNGTNAIDGSSSLTYDGTYFIANAEATFDGNNHYFGDSSTTMTINIDAGTVTAGNINFRHNGVIGSLISGNSADELIFYSGGLNVTLTLDASQNATFAGSIEADGNLTLNNSNTSLYLDDTSGSTAGTDRLQLNIDNDIFSIKSRTASTNSLNEGVWVATNVAGSLTTQEFYVANSVELTLTAGNATFAGDVDADGAFNLKPYCATGTGVNLTTTEATMDISTEVVTHADYSLATDQITIANTGTYQISYTVRVLEDGLSGAQRSSTSFHMEIGGTTEIPQSYTSCYNREDSGPSGASTTFIVELTASDVLTLRGFVDFTSTSNVSQGATQVSIMRVA